VAGRRNFEASVLTLLIFNAPAMPLPIKRFARKLPG